MGSSPFSAVGTSFSIHEWRGSGPSTLHVYRSDDEAWHVLERELHFRYADGAEVAVLELPFLFLPAKRTPTKPDLEPVT